MAEVRATASRVIAAPMDRVRRALTDYQEVRPRLLPDAFSAYRVEEGGVGAGTVFGYHLSAGRRERDYRFRVAQPDPDTVVEDDLASTLVTTWRLRPQPPGTDVAVSVAWQGAGGVGGFFERTFAPRALQRLYAEVLARLDAQVTERAG
jgi:hypothetical protein